MTEDPPLTNDDVRALLQVGRPRSLAAGNVVFAAGAEATDVAYLRAGEVRLERTSAIGRVVVLGHAAAGALVGVASALTRRPHPATVVTTGRCSLVLVRAADLTALLRTRPALAVAVVELLADHGHQLAERTVEYALQDALGRLCRRVVEAIDGNGALEVTDGVVDLACSQVELGERSGLSREAVVKGLRALRDLGWLEGTGDGRRFRVHDEAALRRRATP